MYMETAQRIKKVKFDATITKKKNSLVFSSRMIPYEVVTPLSKSIVEI